MNKELRDKIFYGVDAKILSYDEDETNKCFDKIDLIDIIGKSLFKKPVSTNCILINLEKDLQRYKNTLDEFQKISLDKFVHLKATYWKDKPQLAEDMSVVLEFLKKFNRTIGDTKISIDDFSSISDENIYIQDGPLACYCSHLRAMAYGYLNFEDYTIIVEDDISIANTENIEKYLKMIPDDWDIVFMNSQPKNRKHDEPYYKFVDHFHSGHFYIINHKCMPKLFQNMYPIPDQVDVLVSDLINELNIYNIPRTVYQKNIMTNTQNNLFVIFNSPAYHPVRLQLSVIKELVMFFLDFILTDNAKNNSNMVSHLMYDVIYQFILREQSGVVDHAIEDYRFDNSEYVKLEEYNELTKHVNYFIRGAKKGINSENESERLVNNILFIINKFNLHNKNGMKAYSFGSSSQTYISDCGSILTKKYNDKLRWSKDGHTSSREIFEKETQILSRIQHLDCVPKIFAFDNNDMAISMQYSGESLYYNFALPSDWESQVQKIFKDFFDSGVYYPEFRLHNILVLDGVISFVDFGLSELDSGKDNIDNCNRFIRYLSLLDDRFKSVVDIDEKHRLYDTFLANAGEV